MSNLQDFQKLSAKIQQQDDKLCELNIKFQKQDQRQREHDIKFRKQEEKIEVQESIIVNLEDTVRDQGEKIQEQSEIINDLQMRKYNHILSI